MNLALCTHVIKHPPPCSTHRMGGIPAKSHKGEKLLLFMGIIDILQSYRWDIGGRGLSLFQKVIKIFFSFWKFTEWGQFYILSGLFSVCLLFRLMKKLEHSWKALVYDGVSDLCFVKLEAFLVQLGLSLDSEESRELCVLRVWDWDVGLSLRTRPHKLEQLLK